MPLVLETQAQDVGHVGIVERIVDELPGAPGTDQTQGAQEAQMLGHPRFAHADDGGEVARAHFSTRERMHDGDASRIGEGPEDLGDGTVSLDRGHRAARVRDRRRREAPHVAGVWFVARRRAHTAILHQRLRNHYIELRRLSNIANIGCMEEASHGHLRLRAASETASQIGRLLADLRSAEGETQKQLADRLGMTVSMISRLESGTHLPSLTTLSRLAEGYGRRLDIVFHEHEHQHADGTVHLHAHAHDDEHAHEHEDR